MSITAPTGRADTAPTPQWPRTLRHAPLSCEIPPRYANESTDDYRFRSLRWRSWAVAKLPDLWFVTDDEVAKYRQWIVRLRGAASDGRTE